MKKTQKPQYAFEEYEQHVSLHNIIRAGAGSSVDYLLKIVDKIQNEGFSRNPSILIVGDGAQTMGRALANTLCSEDIRHCEAKYLNTIRGQIDYVTNSLPDTVHLISNVENIGMGESMLWHYLKNRECIFSSIDGKFWEVIHIYGKIILTAKNFDKVPLPIIKGVDFTIHTEKYLRSQLRKVVSQRLAFCSVDCEEVEVLNAIVDGQKDVGQVINLLKNCLLVLDSEMADCCLNQEIVDQAKKLISVPAPPMEGNIPF